MKTKLIAVPIPAKYKWRATDFCGVSYLYTHKPQMDDSFMVWSHIKGEYMSIVDGDLCKDWRNTLERIVEIEWV